MNELHQKWNLDPQRLPRHIGIIMDGNGRWANRRFEPRVFGHRKGVERVRDSVDFTGRIGVEALTLYAFSDENWARPQGEIDTLMGLIRTYVRKDRDELLRNNVRFRVIGDRSRLPDDIVTICGELEEASRDGTGLRLTIALSYGGRNELVRAAQKAAEAVATGQICATDLNADRFEAFLDSAGLPDVDLMIRTSGEQRISNFLLWKIAYAELVFDDAMWPDFTTDRLAAALREYASRERRFGKTSRQVTEANTAPCAEGITL